MFRANCEPTIDEIMRDPMVRALMLADRVDIARFEAKLRSLSRAVRQGPAAVAREPRDGAAEPLLPLVSGLKRAVGAVRHCSC
jgi:hypothetical protein